MWGRRGFVYLRTEIFNMPKPIYIFSFLTIIFCNSCRSIKPTAHPDWVELKLANGWSIDAPKGFKAKLSRRPTDSSPGEIYNTEDNIVAYFDCGYSHLEKSSFSESVRYAKKEIENHYSMYGVPKYNIAYIDTIDGMVAIIVKPNNKGKNLVDISITNHKTLSSLGISDRSFQGGKDLTKDEEFLLLQMFKSIKYKRK